MVLTSLGAKGHGKEVVNTAVLSQCRAFFAETNLGAHT